MTIITGVHGQRRFEMSDKEWSDLNDLVYGPSKFNDLPSILTRALEDFVRRPDNLIRMETAVSLGRAPVEALSDQLIHEFGKEIAHPRIRQFIGQLVRQVMTYLGYEVDGESLRITRLNVFSSGTRYRPAQARDRSATITSEERRAWLNDQQGDAFNRWLDAQVLKPDGTIDVEPLFTLADKWGAKYPPGAILNKSGTPRYPGETLKLVLGILIRKRVPPSEYKPIEEKASKIGPKAQFADPFVNAVENASSLEEIKDLLVDLT
jgi:hypothetical protein